MADDRVPAPRWLAEHEAAFRAAGRTPVTPRLAAKVVLLRPAAVELAEPEAPQFEVCLQRRVATMAFAPGMYAFPGGSVDRTDYEPDVPDSDDSMAVRMALPADAARAVLRAAVRELDEEAGVRLHVHALVPWARWLTPEFEPKRFDAFFFVAAMPAGQSARGDTESDHMLWLPPGAALGLPMLPPTRYTVAELARFPDVASVLAAGNARDVSAPVRPLIEVDADGAWVRLS